MQIGRLKLITRAATAGGALALAVSLAAVTSGQDASSGHAMRHGHHGTGSEQPATSEIEGAACHEMMDAHQDMMSGVDAMDTTLAGLIAQMDAAEGEERVDAMSKVIHELVTQRKRIAHMMSGAQPRMMAHMMSHMHGSGGTMKTAMSECPAMEGMEGASADMDGHEGH